MKEVEPYTKGQERFGRFLIRMFGSIQVFLYKISKGRIANKFNGAHVVVVTMVGRRTGKRRARPLVYAVDGERIIFAASQGGMSSNPLWYHNMMAHPEIEVQIGAKHRMMRVGVAKAEEEKKLWAILDAAYADFKDYRLRAKMTNRKIPLLVAEPRV